MKKTRKKNIAGQMFFISWIKLFFFVMFFLSPEINWFFSEIGNNPMRALGRKKTHVYVLKSKYDSQYILLA